LDDSLVGSGQCEDPRWAPAGTAFNRGRLILNAIHAMKMTVRRGVALGLVAFGVVLVCAPAWGHPLSTAGEGALIKAAERGTPSPRPSLVLLKGSGSSGGSASVRNGRLATKVKRRPRARFSVTPGRLPYLGGRTVLAISASNAKRCTLAASPRFWSGPNPQRVRCHAQYAVTLPALTLPARWTFTLKARGSSRKAAVVRRTLTVQGAPFQLSSNWSGYIVPSSSVITEASGRFTVPHLNCSKTKNGGESMWVGTGGAGSSTGDLLQTGVRSDCSNGVQVDNVGWWELLPPLPEEDFHTMSVAPGDAIQATVMQNPDHSWTTRVDDVTKGISGMMTTGGVYGTVLDSSPTTWLHQEGTSSNLSYTGAYTAEWIVEAFEDISTKNLVPLANFGTVAFTGMTTSLPSWSLTSGEQVGLGSGPLLLAAPSAADATGRGFSVTYTG
jgi:peptidase A4-like protein